MAFDALVTLQDPVKQSTSNAVSTEVDLGGATPVRKPLWAQVRYYWARTTTSPNTATVTFGIEDSADGDTFQDHIAAPPIALTYFANAEDGKSGIVYLPITGARRYVRLTCDFTGSTPSIAYDARLSDSQ